MNTIFPGMLFLIGAATSGFWMGLAVKSLDTVRHDRYDRVLCVICALVFLLMTLFFLAYAVAFFLGALT